jgi:hypothetical protein
MPHPAPETRTVIAAAFEPLNNAWDSSEVGEMTRDELAEYVGDGAVRDGDQYTVRHGGRTIHYTWGDGEPARPERSQWAPSAGRPTYDHEAPPDADAFDAYIEALDLYESKD